MIWNTSVNLREQYIYISKLWSSFIRVSILLAFGMKVPVEGKIREFTRYYFEENYTSRDNKSKKDSILSVTRKVVSKKIFQKSTTEATMSCFNEERKKERKEKKKRKIIDLDIRSESFSIERRLTRWIVEKEEEK